MLKKFCVIAVTGVLVSGCASQNDLSPQEKKYQRVNAAAHQCAEEVKNKTIELTAKGMSTTVRWTTLQYVVTGSDGTENLRAVEYRTSTVLDNDVPGSAWKICMQNADALVPELKF
ncbi:MULTISPECIES: hypothetical protein [Buttiauxella]|jgi:uncharacterized protein YceK|uniref:Lipoprotein n=1 Tax=Buttiauxella ferragutiae ATCC 51602 TaxID=1354252 RepID=A0ABX2W4M0_9ENTR|nr:MULTISPECIES: hypothetical protein [Buttiauxella]AYN30151.1 hypothetical protein D8682_26120 [Buttiauxella sp. 3AFRM03]OAT25654.1 hypothetical protein M976_03548 [Buttiauxella ferragutiae ATCC 51602]TDN53972.1 hypothetical protein EC843_10113 [Buttiauxella sp. JUb87]UNK59532.1 hypothetical protein MNO13_14060 [Buttiauxella ferragutiae]